VPTAGPRCWALLWDVGVALLVIWADRRFKLSHGRAFALYVAAYCVGRLWIETLRIDTAEHFFGVRLNVFTSIVVGLLAVAYLVAQRGRPREVITRGAVVAGARTGEAAPAADRAPEHPVETPADGTAGRRTPPGEGDHPTPG
jgi:phosphatidylglycerol---prolipoprotein diacylglyceryl transferase